MSILAAFIHEAEKEPEPSHTPPPTSDPQPAPPAPKSNPVLPLKPDPVPPRKPEPNRVAASKVRDLINALGAPKDTEEFRKKLNEARWAFNALSVQEKCLIDNYSKLTDAERDSREATERAEAHRRVRKTRNRWILGVCAVLALCAAGVVFFKGDVVFGKTKTKALTEAFFDHAVQGDSFILGRYEQDNNWDNGPEDIEWVVVKSEDSCILAVSKYCLDNRPYNDTGSYEAVDWEHCTLRAWLNGSFYDEAFTEDEKAWIATTDLQNPDGKVFRFPGGNNTADKVFLLSWSDVSANYGLTIDTVIAKREGLDHTVLELYSEPMTYEPLQVRYTDYARETYIQAQKQSWKGRSEAELRTQYAETEQKHGANASYWWLRSPGSDWYSTMIITYSGMAFSNPSQSRGVGVRPAILVRKTRSAVPESSGTENETARPEQLPASTEEPEQVDDSMYPTQIVYGDQQMISVGKDKTVLKLAHFGDKVFDWTDIQKIAVCDDIVFGLTTDGRVLISEEGWELYGRELPLTDIVDLCVCRELVNPENGQYKGCVLCLSQDGTVYYSYAGGFGEYAKDIKAISAYENKYAYVRKDGTVYWDSVRDDTDYSAAAEWSDIEQVVCGEWYIAGLRSDGTVVVSGTYLNEVLNGSYGPSFYTDDDPAKTDVVDVSFDLSGWTDIVSISGGRSHLVGLKSDGTVVAAGLNGYGQCNTGTWENIVRIETGNDVTIGYPPDGNYLVAGKEILANMLALENKHCNAYLCYTK